MIIESVEGVLIFFLAIVKKKEKTSATGGLYIHQEPRGFGRRWSRAPLKIRIPPLNVK